VSSWFVPTTIEERVGGSIVASFGPGMDSVSTITGWLPPHRLAAESQAMGPGSPTTETVWTVEPRGADTCLVRVVHAWSASTSDWDGAFEGIRYGWIAFFRILRLHLTHFRGHAAAPVQLVVMRAAPTAASAWDRLTSALGFAGAVAGARVCTGSGVPRVAGMVEHLGSPEYPEMLLRLEEPAPGLAHLFAMPMGGQVVMPIRLYLHGARAAEVVAREQPAWEAWIAALA
jgi:hypothetical protein